MENNSFLHRYGPWAVIAGASQGTGRAFAKQLAEKGLSLILIARREAPLLELAEEIRSESGVECIPVAIDLSEDDAFDKIVAATGSREVGLYVSNAGADPNGSFFLDREIDTWLNLVSRNLLTTIKCCHHFGGMMRERKKGGLLLVGSGACYGGGDYLATYSGVKAFDFNFSEGLWSELRPHNVDVLCLVMTTTDTPALHELLNEKGKDTPRLIASPEKVAAAGLANLHKGPVYNWGQLFGLRAALRRARIKFINYMSRKMVFGEGQPEKSS